MAFIGIDLHTDRLTEARLTIENEKLTMSKQTYTFNPDPFYRFLESLHTDDYVLIENTSNAFWFHDQICDRVKACYVYDTNELRTDGNKTDKIDAEKLAKKLGYYITMGCEEKEFPTVYVPEETMRELRGLLTTYRFYNKIKTQMKNRIYSILKQNGIPRKKGQISAGPFAKWLEEVELADIWKVQIYSLLGTLKANEAQQQDVKDMILLRGSELFGKQIEILLSNRCEKHRFRLRRFYIFRHDLLIDFVEQCNKRVSTERRPRIGRSLNVLRLVSQTMAGVIQQSKTLLENPNLINSLDLVNRIRYWHPTHMRYQRLFGTIIGESWQCFRQEQMGGLVNDGRMRIQICFQRNG